MKALSNILLAGVLAGSAPGVSLAQNIVVTNVTGSLHLEVDSPLDHVDKTTPITKGRIDIQAGPFVDPVGRPFILTNVNLQFANFSVSTRSLGDRPLPLIGVAAHLRDSIIWWGEEVTPGVPGVYKVEIPIDWIHITGDPTFVGGALVDPSYFNGPHSVETRDFLGEERVSQTITGIIDMNAGTITATAVFKKQAFKVPGVPIQASRKLTITLFGTFSGKGGPGASGSGGTGGTDNTGPIGPGKTGGTMAPSPTKNAPVTRSSQ